MQDVKLKCSLPSLSPPCTGSRAAKLWGIDHVFCLFTPLPSGLHMIKKIHNHTRFILCEWFGVWSVPWGSFLAAMINYLRRHWNTSQVQIISSNLCSMYYQLWHYINLISIDATWFSSAWFCHQIDDTDSAWKCTEHCLCASGDVYKTFVMLPINVTFHQHKGAIVRFIILLLRYFNHNMVLVNDF